MPRVKEKLESWVFSIYLAAFYFLFSLPLLAHTPQNGDGAEFVMLAKQGGVAHPPGFPLQTWIHRLMAIIPAGELTWKLSLISLLFQSAALFLFLEILRTLKASIATRLIAFVAFATLPSYWYLSVQPEVFAGAGFFETLLLYVALTRLTVHPAVFGLIVGLSGSQHPIVLVAAPAIAHLILRYKKIKPILIFLLTSLATLATFYVSLIWQRTSSIWPDWGRLAQLSDVLRHLLREEYGVFSLTDLGTRPIVFSAIGLWLEEIWRSWSIFSLLIPVGLVSLIAADRKKKDFYCISLTLLLALVLLWRSSVASFDFHALTILSRFVGTALIPSSILFALGWDRLVSFAKPRVRPLVHAILLAFLIATTPQKMRSADASLDRTLEIYREAMAASLPKTALPLATTDIDVFYGFQDHDQIIWPFPIGVTNLRWFIDQTQPLFFKRFSEVQKGIHIALLSGETLASVDPGVFGQSPQPIERRGILYVSGPHLKGGYTLEMTRSVIGLCQFVNRLGPLPKGNHFLSHAMHGFFVDAFMDAARFFHLEKKEKLLGLAHRLAVSLQEAQNSEEWPSICSELTTNFYQAYPLFNHP